MNRNDFNRIINNSCSVDRQMVGEVKELLNLFPYFQSAHLLLLKGLHNISDVMFESQLKQSAIYVADREVLYHLINKKAREEPEPEEKVEIKADEPLPADIIKIDIESDNDDLLELDLQEGFSAGDEEDVTPVIEQAETEEKITRKREQAELIDKFIIANPRIEPVREKTDAPVQDISKPFTEEKGGFITETLAKIYITQGYYSRAIDIYEKLSLKFPEKNSYFATQIEKVKELIK